MGTPRVRPGYYSVQLDISQTAKEALAAGTDVVIAAGGDGTVRCVAGVLAGTDTPMGLVPLGTGNLLARNLGIDVLDPLGALMGIDTARTVVLPGERIHGAHSRTC